MRKRLLFILPSYTEGFPNIIIEAMIIVCLIIANEVGAIPGMLQFHFEDKVGEEIPIGNVNVMKDVIYQLLIIEKKQLN